MSQKPSSQPSSQPSSPPNQQKIRAIIEKIKLLNSIDEVPPEDTDDWVIALNRVAEGLKKIDLAPPQE